MHRFLAQLPHLFAGFLFVLGLVLFASSTTATYAGSRVLSVPVYKQEQTQWCWAGTLKMIMRYHGVIATQCAIVSKVFGSCPNNPGTIAQAQTALSAYGFSSAATGVLGSAEVPAEINANRPIFARWVLSTTVGHAVVIRGYDSDSYGSATQIYYNDPWHGSSFTLSYNSFLEGQDSYGQSHSWTDSIWQIRK